MHIQSQQATSTTGSRTVPMEESGSSGVTQNLGLLSGRPTPAPALEDHQDVVTSSESEPDECSSDDTVISSEEDRPVGQFVSCREFLCFGYCCLHNFGRCQALRRRVDQLSSSQLHELFCSRCSCKPVSGSSDWFKVRIGRIFQNIFMSTSCRWHVISTAVLLGAHLSEMHSLTWSMSFPMRVSRTGSDVRCASFCDLAPKRSQHWPGLQQIE